MVKNEVLASRMARLLRRNSLANANHVNKIAHQMRENEKRMPPKDKSND